MIIIILDPEGRRGTTNDLAASISVCLPEPCVTGKFSPVHSLLLWSVFSWLCHILSLDSGHLRVPRSWCREGCFGPDFLMLFFQVRTGLQNGPFSDIIFPSLPLSSPSFCFPHRALQDGLCQAGWSGEMSVSLQLPPLHYSQELMAPNGMLDPVADLGVGYMVCVWDAQDVSLASHFLFSYSAF